MEKPADTASPGEKDARQKKLSHRAARFLVAGAAALVVLAVIGIGARMRQTHNLKQSAEHPNPQVSVIQPENTPASINAVLPGETEAFTEAKIYAQTNGYLKKWNFDIGAHVKKDDILAEIDTPTVDRQLEQAEAQVSEAQAAVQLSQTTYDRQQSLVKGGVISKQDYDNSKGDLQTRQSSLSAGVANVNSLKAQQAFKILHAPFDGIVSARNTDVGALINSSTTTPLFVVSQTAPLRVYIQVPETLAALVKIGEQADLIFDTFPGRTFPAEVVATAGAIDPSSRTLRTQLSVPNETGELYPGAYTQVTLHLAGSGSSITVPANVLLFRSEGPAVGVVGDEGTVKIQKVKIGRDLGTKLEITEGLTSDDQVIVNPSDSLADGDHVEIAKDAADQKSDGQ